MSGSVSMMRTGLGQLGLQPSVNFAGTPDRHATGWTDLHRRREFPLVHPVVDRGLAYLSDKRADFGKSKRPFGARYFVRIRHYAAPCVLPTGYGPFAVKRGSNKALYRLSNWGKEAGTA